MKSNLTDSELSVLAGQLAMLLHSGISSSEGISILLEDAPTEEGKQTLQTVYDTLESTGSLAEALKEGGCPEYFTKMTEIGETSGTLEEVMESLSSYYERQNALTRSIRGALTYPLILLSMLLVILAVLMIRVMPVFEQVFQQMGVEMTGISSAVFRIGHMMQNISAVVLLLVIVIVVLAFLALHRQTGRNRMGALALHLPPIRRVNRLLSCSRFSDALSLALHSGLDMEESFDLAAGLTKKHSFQEPLEKAKALIHEGNDFGASLREAGIFSGLNARMVSLGFRTGSAEETLKKIAVSSQEEADERIQSMVATVEPVLTAVLSILTGLILISVMLPLLGVMTNIG